MTVTSSNSLDGQRVWQLGGELAESGCELAPADLITKAGRCLADVLPGFDPEAPGLSWATYRIDRAEKTTSGALRPSGAWVGTSGPVVVAWPTKLVLAPATAELVVAECGTPRPESAGDRPFADHVPPAVALPPWEEATWS